MNNNQAFLNLYNRLDNYLKTICKVPPHRNVNLISYLEVTLPEQKRSELKTIREYKNKFYSHGVVPGGQIPPATDAMIRWLEAELNYCKAHPQQVAAKVNVALEEARKKKSGYNNRSDNHSSHGRSSDGFSSNKPQQRAVRKCDLCPYFKAGRCGTSYSCPSDVLNRYNMLLRR